MEKLKATQLSNVGQRCYKFERQETLEFKLPVELSFTDAKKLMGYSEKLTAALDVIKDEKKSSDEKEKAQNDLKRAHNNVIMFAVRRKECFEARKVLIMCEMMMLEAGIDPKNIKLEFDLGPDVD